MAEETQKMWVRLSKWGGYPELPDGHSGSRMVLRMHGRKLEGVSTEQKLKPTMNQKSELKVMHL